MVMTDGARGAPRQRWIMEKSVLISGGSGFLGINMIRYLLGKGVTRIRSLDLVEFDYP